MENELMIFDKSELLNIFETEEDRRGSDLLAMSNFFDVLVTRVDKNVVNNGKWEDITNAGNLLGQVAAAIKGGFDISNINMLVADTSHFSKDIVEGLKNGLYHIGESKEVNGNLRPAILDKNERLVRFVTLRKAINPADILTDMSNMTMQMSLKHISAQIEAVSRDVKDISNFIRRQELYVPFLDARGRIIRAANSSAKQQEQMLYDADTYLSHGLDSLYADLQAEVGKLSKYTGLFANLTEVDEILNRINEDMQLIPRYVGLSVYLFNYQDDHDNAAQVIGDYRYQLQSLAQNKIGEDGKYTALEMIHLYYPYGVDDRDFWIEKPKQIIFALNEYEKVLEQKPQDIYYIDMEDCA